MSKPLPSEMMKHLALRILPYVFFVFDVILPQHSLRLVFLMVSCKCCVLQVTDVHKVREVYYFSIKTGLTNDFRLGFHFVSVPNCNFLQFFPILYPRWLLHLVSSQLLESRLACVPRQSENFPHTPFRQCDLCVFASLFRMLLFFLNLTSIRFTKWPFIHLSSLDGRLRTWKLSFRLKVEHFLSFLILIFYGGFGFLYLHSFLRPACVPRHSENFPHSPLQQCVPCVFASLFRTLLVFS